MKESNLLPLGSIAILNGGEKKLMIYGRGQIAENNEAFDYVACLWPEGNLDVEHTYLFNHSDIDMIVHIGYSDDEDLAFLEVLSSQ